jgi:hypothetical protein
MTNAASPEIHQAMMYFYSDRKILVEDHIRTVHVGTADVIHNLSYYAKYRPLFPDIPKDECTRMVEETFTVGFMLRSEEDAPTRHKTSEGGYIPTSMYVNDHLARNKAREEMKRRCARVTNHFDDVARLQAAALAFGYDINDVLALTPYEVSAAFDIILKMNSQPPWSFVLTCLAEDIDAALAAILWTGQILAE